jgi:hypothetical protein
VISDSCGGPRLSLQTGPCPSIRSTVGTQPHVSLSFLTHNSTDDYTAFAKVNNRLLNPPTPLKSVPLRIYIPSSPANDDDSVPAEYKVMQTLMPPRTSSRKFYSTPLSPCFLRLTHATRITPDPRHGAEDSPPVSVPQQPRPRPGQRDLARGAGALLCAVGGADARGGVSGWVALFDCCAAVRY